MAEEDKSFLSSLGHQFEDMVLSCTFRGIQCRYCTYLYFFRARLCNRFTELAEFDRLLVIFVFKFFPILKGNLTLSCIFFLLLSNFTDRFWSKYWHYKYGNCYVFNNELTSSGAKRKLLISNKAGPSHGEFSIWLCCSYRRISRHWKVFSQLFTEASVPAIVVSMFLKYWTTLK